MIRITCGNVTDINELFNLIKDKYCNDFSKIWSLEEKEIGIFLHEHIGIPAGNVFTIMTLVDFNKSTRNCEMSVRYVGGAVSLIGIGRSEDFISTMTKDIARLANENGWTHEIEKIKIRPAGSMCPHCGASYKYPQEKRREDGSVDCQNCGKSFAPN